MSMFLKASSSFSRPHEVIVECSAAGIDNPATGRLMEVSIGSGTVQPELLSSPP